MKNEEEKKVAKNSDKTNRWNGRTLKQREEQKIDDD